MTQLKASERSSNALLPPLAPSTSPARAYVQRCSRGNKTCFISYLGTGSYRHYFLAPFPRGVKFSSDVLAKTQFPAFVNNAIMWGCHSSAISQRELSDNDNGRFIHILFSVPFVPIRVDVIIEIPCFMDTMGAIHGLR